MKHHGIEITKVMDEEFCYIPMGGAMPNLNQVSHVKSIKSCHVIHTTLTFRFSVIWYLSYGIWGSLPRCVSFMR